MEKERLTGLLLSEVEAEARRFLKKVDAARERIASDRNTYSTKETGAVRRAAHDLKRELTRITQSKIY